AFALQPGEVSRVLETPQGLVVLKCDKLSPPDTSKKFEQEREKLAKEVFDKKLRIEIAKVFNELKEQAHPQVFLKSAMTEEELKPSSRNLLESTKMDEGMKAAPRGN